MYELKFSERPHISLGCSPGGLVGLFLQVIGGKLRIDGSKFIGKFLISAVIELSLADCDRLLLASLR